MMGGMDLPPELANLLAQSFPLRAGDASLDVASVTVDSSGNIRATAQLVLYEDGAAHTWKDQDVDLGPADVRSLQRRIDSARARLESLDLDAAMPDDLLRERPPRRVTARGRPPRA